MDSALRDGDLAIRPMPSRALCLAGKAFARYRPSGGKRTGVLPDFFVGAQASAETRTVLTRDPARYRTYFPAVVIIAPDL